MEKGIEKKEQKRYGNRMQYKTFFEISRQKSDKTSLHTTARTDRMQVFFHRAH